MFKSFHFSLSPYLSSLQHGIQAAHGQTALSVLYSNKESVVSDIYNDWAVNYVTTVCKSGGNIHDLSAISKQLIPFSDIYPIAIVRDYGLGDIISSVAIILPEKIYVDALRLYAEYLANTVHMHYNSIKDAHVITKGSDSSGYTIIAELTKIEWYLAKLLHDSSTEL